MYSFGSTKRIARKASLLMQKGGVLVLQGLLQELGSFILSAPPVNHMHAYAIIREFVLVPEVLTEETQQSVLSIIWHKVCILSLCNTSALSLHLDKACTHWRAVRSHKQCKAAML